ncbi:hypothetical protein MAIT1_02027 [Magnetofaba australis IT-1]|uniref:Uncharacterized protein n=1 Tax=Magnetofaba australis IT-1 TaxID=1434232 RepID=A0A1Y2K1P7_9PROT|nr:hypothetical protein MAIT1_02027 [Magnetofaba australis IT-1]
MPTPACDARQIGFAGRRALRRNHPHRVKRQQCGHLFGQGLDAHFAAYAKGAHHLAHGHPLVVPAHGLDSAGSQGQQD